MTTKLLSALFALVAALAGCGGPAEDVTPTESAAIFPDYNAMADAVWGYYTGGYTGARPTQAMRQPDKKCSPLALGGGLYAYRRPSVLGICLDTGSQNTTAPYNYGATFEIWQNHTPNLQMPWEATLAINYLCTAAYERAGFTAAQAYPYCSGSASSTVPAVRHWIHDTFNASQPYWQ